MNPVMEAPERTLDQRMVALGRANEVRSARGDWKVAVALGEEDPVAVFRDPPRDFETMKVFDALIAVPKIGRVKANGILRGNRISPSKTVAGMTARQRDAIVFEVLAITRRCR